MKINNKCSPIFSIATFDEIEKLVSLIINFRDFLGQEAPSDRQIQLATNISLKDPNIKFIIGYLDKKQSIAIGYTQIRFYYSLWLPGLEAKLEDLFVISEFRNNKIGLKLVEYTFEYARIKGCKLISLNTNENNYIALNLYNKLGFCVERSRWNNGRQLWLEKIF